MKVNVGSSKLKKEFFPVSFDSSTTTNFGECVPCFAHELPPDTHAAVDLRSGVRFAPLSLPTFGKAFLHSYLYCHKMTDLYPPFADLLAQTQYTSGSGSVYIPTEVPSVPLFAIWLTVLSHASFSLISARKGGSALGSSDPIVFTKTQYKTVDPVSASVTAEMLGQGLVRSLLSANFLNSAYNIPYRNQIRTYLASSAPGRRDNFVSPYGSVISTYDPTISPGSSDYIVELESNYVYYLDSNGNFKGSELPVLPSGEVYCLCVRLNNAGKYLRKIFMGLGYQITPLYSKVSFLPVFAYFRSYFDTFAPKRFIKYDQTYFGRLMAELVSTGKSLMSSVLDTSITSTFSGLVDDLLSCYFTKDTDYYSAQIIGMVNDYGSDLYANYMGVDRNDSSPQVEEISSDVQRGAVPGLEFVNTMHTQAQQNVLSRLTEFVNRRSALGGKIADLLESVFGIKKSAVLCDKPYVGSSIIDVNFSDVFSTAETQEGSLGEYAGKASGFGSSDTYHVNTDVHSIMVCFSVLVPRTQYVQGVNPNLFHTSQYDFYSPQFDGLTLVPSNRLSFVATPSVFYSSLYNSMPSFGNIPLYTEYKTRSQGILNGDLSLLSTKSSYDSFTMDETFSDYVIEDTTDADNLTLFAVKPNLPNIASGTMWRFIGRWVWLGNFDRIFVNNRITLEDYEKLLSLGARKLFYRDVTRSDDNLVIHNIVDMKINAPMLPLSDSFMTKDLNELDNGVGVTAQGE